MRLAASKMVHFQIGNGTPDHRRTTAAKSTPPTTVGPRPRNPHPRPPEHHGRIDRASRKGEREQVMKNLKRARKKSKTETRKISRFCHNLKRARKKAKLKLEKYPDFAISPQCWIKTASKMSSMGPAQRSPAEHRGLRKWTIPVSKSTIFHAKWHMFARKWLIYYWDFGTFPQCWILCGPPLPSMLVFHEKFLHFLRDVERRNARDPR